MAVDSSEQSKIRVMTVDDHPLVREGIAALVNNQPDMEIAAMADSSETALKYFQSASPNVVLMDLRLGAESGIDTMESLLKIDPSARVIILTMIEGDVGIRRALKAGAKGYVFKSLPPKELLHVIRSVFAGRRYVSPEIALICSAETRGVGDDERGADVENTERRRPRSRYS